MANKMRVVQPTKEQIEYEDARKNFRVATTKARLSSAGIDPLKISRQVVDKATKIFDDMDHVQQSTQQKTSKIKQDAETEIQKINQEANQKFGELQKKYQDLIISIKNDNKEKIVEADVNVQTDEWPEVKAVQTSEEVREKTHEEKVFEITNTVLMAVRDSISEKVNEILITVDKKVNETVVKDEDNKDGKNVNVQKEESGQELMKESV